MINETERKLFEEPICEVCRFDVADIITASGDDDWGGGWQEFGIRDV